MIRALLRRVWNAFAWLPALADRPGLRWLLSGRVVGAPIVVLTHRGRRSGKVYRTPVEAISEDPVRHEVVVSPMRGRRGDWIATSSRAVSSRRAFAGRASYRPGGSCRSPSAPMRCAATAATIRCTGGSS